MKYFTKNFISVVFYFLLIFTPIYKLNAQKSGALVAINNTPLHVFFQNNFDTTIILYSWNNWFPYANFKIISKLSGNIFTYTYRCHVEPGIRGYLQPGGLEIKFLSEIDKFQVTVPDTNQFFLPTYRSPALRISAWQEINELVWKLQPDVDMTAKNNKPQLLNICDDCSHEDFFLITKKGIEKKEFYALGEIEDKGFTIENRQHAFNIVKIFKELFR